jgi:hypothetical protein
VGPAPGKVLLRGHSVVGNGSWFLSDTSLVSGLFAAGVFEYIFGVRVLVVKG